MCSVALATYLFGFALIVGSPNGIQELRATLSVLFTFTGLSAVGSLVLRLIDRSRETRGYLWYLWQIVTITLGLCVLISIIAYTFLPSLVHDLCVIPPATVQPESWDRK
jgi:hypothetical protein